MKTCFFIKDFYYVRDEGFETPLRPSATSPARGEDVRRDFLASQEGGRTNLAQNTLPPLRGKCPEDKGGCDSETVLYSVNDATNKLDTPLPPSGTSPAGGEDVRRDFLAHQASIKVIHADEIDISFVPPLVRRKLSLLDKTVLALTEKVFNENVKELVFSSEYGEFKRLDTIISQYQEMGEVSPAQFSASVHNYPVSFFTQYKKLNIPYHAISSGENSLAAGFVKSMISKNETIFVYADVKDGIRGVSCLISKTEGKLKIEYDSTPSSNMNFSKFIDFLEGKNEIYTSNFGTFKKIVD